MEPRGSWLLKGPTAYYSRAVKTGTWHQAREADPKDYELSLADVRNLHFSTYKKIGPGDAKWPKTTYNDQCDQVLDACKEHERETNNAMIQEETIGNANLDREFLDMKRSYTSVLPRFKPGYDKHHLQTTHRADYISHFPNSETEKEGNDGLQTSIQTTDFDITNANKRCLSQFGDTANHRRPGINTFQDETGIYANTHFKRQAHSSTNPITG